VWVVKGIFLGAGFFVVLIIAFLFLTVFSGSSDTYATDLSVITSATIHNPLFYVVLIPCLALGCAIVGSWPVRIP
jgi:hypothetical protein